MRECVRIRRSDAAETGRGRGGSPRSQREQSAAATRGSSADATRWAEGPSPRADSRAAGRLEGVREGPGRGAAVRGSPEALPGGPSPLPCEATAAASAAPPPLLAARPGAVTLRPPVSRGSATKQKRAVRPQVDFALAEIYADPGVPSSPRWHVAPSQPPEVFSPASPWEALPPRTPRPSESPPAARGPQARCTGAERISRTRPMPLAGGMRGVFLPGDLSGPPLWSVSETDREDRAELPGRERGQRPWPWGLRDTTVPGATASAGPFTGSVTSAPKSPSSAPCVGPSWAHVVPSCCFGSRSTWP